MLKQKHFCDIEVARVNDDEFKMNNVSGFAVGDWIQVSEKVDGSNASIYWNEETNQLEACSRKQILSFGNTLNGFWNYVQALPQKVTDFLKANPNLVIFGEWGCNNNKIKDYPEELRHTWIVYDVYNAITQRYELQAEVKDIAANLGFTYIHALYEGPFISWDHIKTFLHANSYGGSQEGVVVKNQSKLDNTNSRQPQYLKIVNESFKEKMATRVKKEKSADELEEEARVQSIIDAIVTPARIEKGIYKLRDEGVLPEKLEPKDMKLVAKNLPSYIYQDCLKEEAEMVQSAGELFGKYCGSRVMQIARQLILG